MMIGSTTACLSHLPVEEAFALLHANGIRSVELGSGGYVDASHLQPKAMVNSGKAVARLKELLAENDLVISALSCPGNPLHPDKAVAAKHHQDFIDSCHLAKALGVDTLMVFSGCPGDSAGSKAPNFVSCRFPPEMEAVLEWQWERVLIPYWKEAAAIAASYGIRRIGVEMMAGQCVHNPETLWHLRDEIGSAIGATVDVAHLIRQGIDPATAIRALKGAVYQVHVKDGMFSAAARAENGVFDTDYRGKKSPFAPKAVGAAHDETYWVNIVRALRDIGYDRSLTIEHDDAAISAENGITMTAKCIASVW